VWSTTPIPPIRAEWTASGACTSGSTAHQGAQRDGLWWRRHDDTTSAEPRLEEHCLDVCRIWGRQRLRCRTKINAKEKTNAIHDADDPNVSETIRSWTPLCARPQESSRDGRFNEELGKAVKILSLNGLHPLNTGRGVSFGKGKPMVTDGPFIETKEVLGGYWLVEAGSKKSS